MVFLKRKVSPNNISKPIFVYLDQGQIGNYTPTLYQNLANAYANHQKGSDYLVYFVNNSNQAFTYLSSTMTGTVTIPTKGSVYSSYVDANTDAPTVKGLGYGIQFYDYEKNQTDCCELPTGLTGATIPCHVGGACAGNIATGSSSTSATNFFTTANANGLLMGVSPAGMSNTDITNLAINSTVYVLQAQQLINGDQSTLLGNWNSSSVGTPKILAGNPNAKIIVQMQTSTSTLAQMKIAWDTLRTASHPPDGLTIYYVTSSSNVSSDITQIDNMFTYAENHFY